MFSNFAKDWLPPVLLSQFRKINRGKEITFEGPFASWDEAVTVSSGYDNNQILNKVLAATLKVKNGDAAYERDSVLFDKIQYSWPVTAGLMCAAAQDGGHLSVLDFGGSLGSSYFQNRQFLEGLKDVRWSVVEQYHFVKAGQEYIQDNQLRFYETIDDCVLIEKPNVLLLSAVLQYLENPEPILNELLTLNSKIIVVDLAIINKGIESKIYLQKVPSSIYSASYPVWSFQQQSFLEIFKNYGYSLITDFKTLDFPSLTKIDSFFKGYFFCKITK